MAAAAASLHGRVQIGNGQKLSSDVVGDQISILQRHIPHGTPHLNAAHFHTLLIKRIVQNKKLIVRKSRIQITVTGSALIEKRLNRGHFPQAVQK